MKIIVLNLICGIAGVYAASVTWTEEERHLESEQVALWEANIEQAKSKPNEALFEDLWLGFRKMGHRKTWDGHNPKVDSVNLALQNLFLSIPGHAAHFRNKIENERATLESKDYRGRYDENRRLAFEVLSHLPSPETIRVLGEYLDDERDASKEAIWEDHGLLLGMDPNCEHAADSLQKIGLRDTGISEPESGEWPSSENYASREEAKRAVFNFYIAQREKKLNPWRTWWEEVESGRRAFSFKGQAVEYRFKPDGSWNTIPIANPPNDGPKSVSEIKNDRPARTPMSGDADARNTPRGSSWWWYGISGAALLATCVCLWQKKR